ncbi:MAG TPA: hypothetical protein PK970_13985 [Hyphomicrobiaceae bacterium]|nr:hypothetical protein [Hyphomicrobiaceae bacterium]
MPSSNVSTLRTPLTETSTVLVIGRLNIDPANDNGATERRHWLDRLPPVSPALAFVTGFSSAGILVAAETMLRLAN